LCQDVPHSGIDVPAGSIAVVLDKHGLGEQCLNGAIVTGREVTKARARRPLA
jgi:hypothetical protein